MVIELVEMTELSLRPFDKLRDRRLRDQDEIFFVGIGEHLARADDSLQRT